MSGSSAETAPGARRGLGATGLRVSPLCVGGAEFGSVAALGYEVPEDRALATLQAVFASPINFLDTGAAYGQGESERRIGLAVRELGGLPAGFVLATKADRDPGRASSSMSGLPVGRLISSSATSRPRCSRWRCRITATHCWIAPLSRCSRWLPDMASRW